MGKSLVIVESPAKAKTINKYLGNKYVVKSSIGHIRDLPTSGSICASKDPAVQHTQVTAGMGPVLTSKEKAYKQLVLRMGVDPEHGWKAKYRILPGKERVIEELRRLAKDADIIYLATDLDREGEAIAWHLRETIGGDNSRYKRVVFNEITKKAIQVAFSKPSKLDIKRVNAQQARRFLDRVVGYMVSPLLWAKIARGLSAGRVQSVAVKLVVEREREIRAFNPKEYWEVQVDLGVANGINVRFEVIREQDEIFKPLNETQTMVALEKLKASRYSIVNREDKLTSSKPPAPFITSTLQQAASNRLGFNVNKTMILAQRLYEAGYITYMRTDSTNLSEDAVAMARAYIQGEFGKKYLPEKPNVYSCQEGAKEAHEAIRPSNTNTKPSKLNGIERDAERLYELIWRQLLACQMLPAQYLSTTISVSAGDFELRAKSRLLRFDGYIRMMPQISKLSDNDILPNMAHGDTLKLIKLNPLQHFTKPLARYSEASLVKEMEKRGIGRPSTYAVIISTIQDRGYVALHNRRFYSEKIGDIVTERLSESFSNLMDYGFTAGMEENLDDVAHGWRDWKSVLDEFYSDFKKKLEIAKSTENGMRVNQPVMTDIPCLACRRSMQIRIASTGVFLSCSGYNLPSNKRCKATVNLVPGDEIAADDEGESESLVLRRKHRCHICSTAMDAYLLNEKHQMHICGNNPDCDGYEIEEGSYRIKGYKGSSLICDKCGSEMQLKTGRFGKFFGCTNLICKNTRKLLKSGSAAPSKMYPVKMPELKCEKVKDIYILRDGASGLFLAASQFPKNRETRAPLVLEIAPHKDEIDPKYHFLCEAPKRDPDGRPVVIRYSRKTKEQYVQTEVDGKPSGWKAFYDGDKWEIKDKRPGV
ncbi:type I DNA topoisomerase [Candidatus Pseudomonas adelgestsugas]|uniref:DNA topoisomerase 1 n=1 Tax=Candidatus Pseudomonas adelgestsugas TaxID=1302376 RepID=A0ABX5R9D3_9PSED|nr:type I DNA topoisomerase [Candidatus Pseudomonas adelgestsugas]QAX82036.1 DNA topoisomerase 1 [Candidatus Pseudomonas adelgestsugas]